LFTVGCLVSPILALVFPFFPKNSYLRRFVKAADRMMAAMLGYSGKFTLSVESATEPKLEWLHLMLNKIEDNHCEQEMLKEHAYCRIKQRDLGDK